MASRTHEAREQALCLSVDKINALLRFNFVVDQRQNEFLGLGIDDQIVEGLFVPLHRLEVSDL